MAYQFVFRDPMPPGFLNNDRIPELPACHAYLQGLIGKRYETIHAFEEELKGFGQYLTDKKIPQGLDTHVRHGIFVFEENAVGVRNSGMSRRCRFGTLEKIADPQE